MTVGVCVGAGVGASSYTTPPIPVNVASTSSSSKPPPRSVVHASSSSTASASLHSVKP